MAIKTRIIYSPNFDATKRKRQKIRFLVFHYTGMKRENEAIQRLTQIQSEVGTHYYIKKNGEITFISPSAETSTRTFEIEIEADNSDLSFKSGITTSIMIEGSELLAHKIPPSILTLQDDGTIGVKALDENNTVIFYPIQKVKDTIDGMWVSGLPNEINLIISGQEYVSSGQIIELK